MYLLRTFQNSAASHSANQAAAVRVPAEWEDSGSQDCYNRPGRALLTPPQ